MPFRAWPESGLSNGYTDWVVRPPAPQRGMTAKAIRRELRRHHSVRFTCQCLPCLFGRALLAEAESDAPGFVVRIWNRFFPAVA